MSKAMITWFAWLIPSVALFAAEPYALELLEEQAFRAAVERVRPAVVRIDLIGSSTASGEIVTAGPTNGIIVSKDGYILTSAFAFSTSPASILVTLHDGIQSPARVVATDHSRQLVLLKLDDRTDLNPAVNASRDELAVGQWAIAIGRVIANDRPSVSVGILSALSRLHGRAVQTDAAISPTNYGGPLIGIDGRVIGVLTPLAPENQEGASSAEWYDSGIGFAVPLADYQTSLTRLKAGEDLYRGLLGVGLERGLEQESPPVIASVRPQSPAADVGLKVGDRIRAMGDNELATQADLHRFLGQHYAGDTITLQIERGESKLTTSPKLVRKLEPFRHAALGIRPQYNKNENPNGVQVSSLETNGPASKAGIEVNDLIVQAGEQAISTVDELVEFVHSRAPGDKVSLTINRLGKPREVSVTLSERTSDVYPSNDADPTEATLGPPPGVQREIKLPEFSKACPIYVPSEGIESKPLGLLILLQPGKQPVDPERLQKWQVAAEKHHLLIALPEPQDGRGWSERDIEYVKQLMRTLIEKYQIDRRRIALGGSEIENRVTFALWLANRDLVRGIVFGSAQMPQRLRIPDNTPQQPCLCLLKAARDDRQTARTVKLFTESGFSPSVATEAEPDAVAGWVDSLDRL